ncbi:MAG: hypothetical protein ACP5K1_06860 [Candidatus Bathyarchaeia archaeon]
MRRRGAGVEGRLTRGLLKALKRGRKGIISICPKCGYPRIHQLNSLGGWLTPPIYICDKCGYAGPILLEIEGEAMAARGGASKPLRSPPSMEDENP